MIPKLEITDKGYKVPTTSEINAGVWQVLASSLGESISRVQGTPQYQLATSLTAIIRDAYDKTVALGNQFDPRYANGIYQDAVAELYFLQRKLATHSIAQVTFTGLNGAVIPQGFVLLDANGNRWETTGQYNIGASGTVTGQVIAQESGAIEANIGSINTLVSALAGVDSVTNTDSAIAGYNEEDRQDFEIRRRESVAINSKMTDDATRSAVLAVDNVVDCYVQSNPTDSTRTYGSTNYPAIRNSIIVSAVGGDDYEVAKTAFTKAGTGCSWNGNTDVTVRDDSYGNNPPLYPIKILRPDFMDVYLKVSVLDRNSVTYQDEKACKDHILSALKNGSLKARIGGEIIPAMYISGLPSIGVVSVLVSTDGSTWVDRLPVGIDQYPSVDEFRISVVQA